MSWKCFFGHDFKETARQAVNVLDNETSTIPTRTYTRVLLSCERCGFKKTYSIDGNWIKKNDDDGGDDDKSPNLSPDDYFDKIERVNK